MSSSDGFRHSRSSRRKDAQPRTHSRARSPSRSSSEARRGSSKKIIDPYYVDWDLVKLPDRPFPNWDTYTNVADTFRQCSRKTIKHLTSHNVLENMPTVPSPCDIATLNNIERMVKSWRLAEEDLSRDNGLMMRGNKYADERAWTSWVRTQSRDFGSAVWRLLRLNRWKDVQNPRIKGL